MPTSKNLTQAATTGSSQLTPRLRDAFWRSVEACLVGFLSESKENAAFQTSLLRHESDNPPPNIDGDMIYHDEPFYVACDIAEIYDLGEQERLLMPNAKRYKRILTRHGW